MGYVNMNDKLIKKGGRNAVKISEEFLLNKLFELHKKSSDSSEYENIQQFVDSNVSYYALLENNKIENDLSKIQFDGENYCTSKEDYWRDEEKDNLLGINTLNNGLTFLGCIAGGDWEYPVFFIIYWDGKSLRGYIPSYGNCINLDFKTAFGSEEDSESTDEEIVLKKSKYKDFNVREDEFSSYYFKCEGLSGADNPDINWGAVKIDIENRIVIK